MLLKYIDIPDALWKNIYQTGSSVICNPPVTDTDIDFVIFSKTSFRLNSWLEKQGFSLSINNEEYDLSENGSAIYCLRKENINLIIVDDYQFYLRWVIATDLAKQFNLLKKTDRIDLFQAILYPEEPSFYDC